MNQKFIKLFKKEILSILRDKKSFLSFIVISLIITPALILGVGTLQKFQQDQLAKEEAVIAIKNQDISPELVDYIKNTGEIKIVETNEFETDLESKDIKGYLELSLKDQATNVRFIYDQSSNASVATSLKVNAAIQAYSVLARQDILQEHDLTEAELNPVIYEQITLQEVQNKPAQNDFVLMFLPYIIMLGLIQGAAQFAIELTAGEKERNTLATTLSLNASRVTIGLSKIAAILLLSLFSLILNVTSLIVTFSLAPSEVFGGPESTQLQFNITPTTVFQIFLILLPLSFLIASLLVLLGTYARNQKEGGLYLLPLMLGAIFIGLSGQAFDVNTPATIFSIPLVGHVALIKQVLLGYFIPVNYLISVVSTFLLFIIVLYVSINMFKREEVIFRQ